LIFLFTFLWIIFLLNKKLISFLFFIFSVLTSLVIERNLEQANKKKLYELKSNRRITLMVLWTSVLYFICMTPYNISIALRQILPSSSQLTLFNLISSTLLTFAHGATFFVYLTFNNMFRRVFYLKFEKFFDFST